MSHTRLKTTYSEQDEYGGTKRSELYCHHNHTTDTVTFYDETGELMRMSFNSWIFGDDLWDAMNKLWTPFVNDWGGELKSGIEYCVKWPWEL